MSDVNAAFYFCRSNQRNVVEVGVVEIAVNVRDEDRDHEAFCEGG
jgi:hypothetical protein